VSVSGFPELIPLALGAETILCGVAAAVFSRPGQTLPLFGSS
jgi:hypothetical protein